MGACQLTDYELTGLIADIVQDSNGLIVFSDHVKRVVSIIFELRRNQLLNAYFQEGAFDKLEIPTPDLAKLERVFPLLPPGWKRKDDDASDLGRTSGRISGRRLSGRRPSFSRDSGVASNVGSRQ